MPFREKYINLLTDFGFKRVFGTESNKNLLIDFLNTLLPPHHQIQDLTFINTENLGSTALDRKAIFDIYCQGENGERFIVEIQKAQQTYFKDRSIYYSTFPIQEQAEQGDWNYQLTPVYSVAILNFTFQEHKDEDECVQIVELKNQNNKAFYPKLKYIYIELPKFTKTLEESENHLDKWLYIIKHLAELTERPEPLESEVIFNQLFEVAQIANFSPTEQTSYQSSLKYYRDWYSIMETSRTKGWQQGLQQGEVTIIMRLLSRTLGEIPQEQQELINQLSLDRLEGLSEALLDFSSLDDLIVWLNQT